jgi:hypothetical protein
MMKKTIITLAILASTSSFAQTLINQGTYDAKTLVDTNSTSNSISSVNTTNTSTSTSTNNNNSLVNSTNTNNNINSGTVTYNNNNVQSGTSTNINQTTTSGTMTNTNINSGTMTYNNNTASTATNTNLNTSNATNVNQNIQSGEMTNRNINETMVTQKLVQPPPTAIAPPMMSVGTDLCVTGVSAATQTQIFGFSIGSTMRDANCERLKLSKTLFDMGMKVAAVATMCQDRRVFDAMLQAGTPCPYEGLIGDKAKEAWLNNPKKIPTVGLKD